MPDIFISYAREDLQRIAPLVASLEAQGWTVFWDRKIPTGKTWRDHIGDALADARCVVVAWSHASIQSRWVAEEADEGQKRGILVPVRLDAVEPPIGFRSVQSADLMGLTTTSPAPALEGLMNDIAALIRRPRPPGRSDSTSREMTRRLPSNRALVVVGLLSLPVIAAAAYFAILLIPSSTGDQADGRIGAVRPSLKRAVPLAGAFHAQRWSKTAGTGGHRFVDGALQVFTHRGQLLVEAADSWISKDYIYAARTTVVSGPAQLGFGLVFGLKDRDNYFLFAKRTGGAYRLVENRDAVEHTVLPWTASTAITAVNHPQTLKVETEGAFVTLMADGKRLQQVRLPREPWGSIGTFVAGPGLTVTFSEVAFGPRN